jgi:hypothetical protein
MPPVLTVRFSTTRKKRLSTRRPIRITTNAAAIMIGEKAADLVAADAAL